MGTGFSKDGVVTRVVEAAVPGGGLVTAIFHSAAGNETHAKKAMISGFGTAIAAPLGVVEGILVGASAETVQYLIDEAELSNEKKKEVQRALDKGNSEEAARIVVEEVQKKMKDNVYAVSCDGGRRTLRSVHGSYLRANEPEWKVDVVPRAPQAWEHWYIEDHDGKVALKGRGGPNKPVQYLRAHPDGSVTLQKHAMRCEMWQPFKNHDGSWSFMSYNDQWLSADQSGRVYTVGKCFDYEHFWLERW